MNAYLKCYCRYIIDCKETVTISDTQKYISNNEFDINEIISHFQKNIDLDEIFNLVNSKKFYKGHSRKDKYLLLIQFFHMIHNYSKNLILKYDVYSTKSIKTDTTNVKDCLIYIPNYENYLSALLGYSYNEEKSEWYIDGEISLNGNLMFAATCLICGFAHQKLTKSLEEAQFSKDDDSTESSKSALTIKKNNWTCDSCSFSNDLKSINCEMCFHPHDVVNLEEKKPIDKVKENQWQCKKCTFINDLADNVCFTCGYSLKSTQNENNNKLILKKNSVNTTVQQMKLKNNNSFKKQSLSPCDPNYQQSNLDNSRNPELSRSFIKNKNNNNLNNRRSSSEHDLNYRQSNQWSCKECTFVNKKENLNCEICKKNQMPNFVDNRNPTNNNKHVPELSRSFIKNKNNNNLNIRRSSSEHGLIYRQSNQWQCNKCTLINENENLNCKACSNERVSRKISIPTNYPGDNNNQISDNTLGNSTIYNGQKPDLVQVVNKTTNVSQNVVTNGNSQIKQSNEWICKKCTFVNKKANLNCEMCLKKNQMPNIVDNRNTSNNNKHVPEISRSFIKNENNDFNNRQSSPKHDLNYRPLNQWKCIKCSHINDKENLNCKSCTAKHGDRMNSKPRIIPRDISNQNHPPHTARPHNGKDNGKDKKVPAMPIKNNNSNQTSKNIHQHKQQNNPEHIKSNPGTSSLSNEKERKICDKCNKPKKFLHICKLKKWMCGL